MTAPTSSSPEVRFGADLRLLGNLLTAEQRERGSDLLTGPRPQLADVEHPERNHDLLRTVGDENLEQALLLRFLTEVGELTHLGHPNYGSRLHLLIGELNTPTTRNRAKLFALQALADEPRVAAVRSIRVDPHPDDPRTGLLIQIEVVSILTGSVLLLQVPVAPEGATP